MDYKTTIIEIVLKHMNFLLICVVHLFCTKHDTHAPSIYAYYLFFCLFCDKSIHVQMLGVKNVFKIPLLD